MIQPISNSVNFSGISIGGNSYGAIKFISSNIKGIQDPNIQSAVTKNLAGLQEYASGIVPQGKEFGLFFKQKGGLTVDGSSKIAIAIKELTSRNEAPVFTVSKKIQGKNSKEDKLPQVVEGVFADAKKKIDGIFQNTKTTKGQHFDISL